MCSFWGWTRGSPSRATVWSAGPAIIWKTSPSARCGPPPARPCPNAFSSYTVSCSTMFADYQPEAVAVEELFFCKNARTAMIVGQARGVVLLAAADAGLAVAEYTPLQVKQAVVGYGRAEKRQVQEMVRVLLALHELPKPDDAADALAIAICHAHSYRRQEEASLP